MKKKPGCWVEIDCGAMMLFDADNIGIDCYELPDPVLDNPGAEDNRAIDAQLGKWHKTHDFDYNQAVEDVSEYLYE